MQSMLFLTLAMTMAAASPASPPAVVSPGQETVKRDPAVDLVPLMKAAEKIQINLDLLVQLLNEAQLDALALTPHVIRKRETEVSGNVEAGPDGPKGNVDVTHKSGDTTINANVNADRSGTGYGVGVEHRSRDGNARIGGYVNRDTTGQTSAGLDFRYKFRK